MNKVYMIKYIAEDGEHRLYYSGKNMTPFSTENFGSAKSQATKLIEKAYVAQVNIVEIDFDNNEMITLDRYGHR